MEKFIRTSIVGDDYTTAIAEQASKQLQELVWLVECHTTRLVRTHAPAEQPNISWKLYCHLDVLTAYLLEVEQHLQTEAEELHSLYGSRRGRESTLPENE